MTKIVYFLVLVSAIGHDQYSAQQVDSFNFKPRCELAVNARTTLLTIEQQQAYVCIKKEIKNADRK